MGQDRSLLLNCDTSKNIVTVLTLKAPTCGSIAEGEIRGPVETRHLVYYNPWKILLGCYEPGRRSQISRQYANSARGQPPNATCAHPHIDPSK